MEATQFDTEPPPYAPGVEQPDVQVYDNEHPPPEAQVAEYPPLTVYPDAPLGDAQPQPDLTAGYYPNAPIVAEVPISAQPQPDFQPGYPPQPLQPVAPPSYAPEVLYAQSPNPQPVPGAQPRVAAQNPIAATHVVVAQPATTTVVRSTRRSGPPPQDLLGLSLFNCLCCCWCIGIFAIIASLQVNQAWSRGDRAGAYAAANQAKSLNIAGITCGFIIYAIVFVLVLISNLT